MVNDKKTGAFFTPSILARSVIKHLDLHFRQSTRRDLAVLEPSVGHGVFLQALVDVEEIHRRIATIDVVDIEQAFIEKSRDVALPDVEVKYACEDFITFEGRSGGYDVIVGNPPYVSYKHLSQSQVTAARAFFTATDLATSDFRNLWTLFILKASVLLKSDGIMAFVLPKEVIYVNHAGWLRSLLLETFNRIEVFVFDELHFDHADQDVAVIFCYRIHEAVGLHISEGQGGQLDPEGLRSIEVDQFYNSKWSQFKISDDDNTLLGRCIKNFQPLETYCTAVAGIVPAANNFFIVDAIQVDALEANTFARPIVQKSNYLGKNLVLDAALMEGIVASGAAAFLLVGYDYHNPPPALAAYLTTGEALGLDRRYKMTKRTPWHRIPGIWPGDALFFKRIGEFPKFVLNSAAALATDTAYRVTPGEGTDLRSLIFSFYNSLTIVAAELRGRTYGGGVLELTPNEFKRLPVPYSLVSKTEFDLFVTRMRTTSFADALAVQDKFLLPQVGISASDIKALQRVRQELFTKRLKKVRPKQ